MTCVVMTFVGRPGKQQTLSYAKVNIAICPENISRQRDRMNRQKMSAAIFCKNNGCRVSLTGFALDDVSRVHGRR